MTPTLSTSSIILDVIQNNSVAKENDFDSRLQSLFSPFTTSSESIFNLFRLIFPPSRRFVRSKLSEIWFVVTYSQSMLETNLTRSLKNGLMRINRTAAKLRMNPLFQGSAKRSVTSRILPSELICLLTSEMSRVAHCNTLARFALRAFNNIPATFS